MDGVLRPLLLGGVDGVITSFAIVAGGASLGIKAVVLVGLSSVVADGMSMGVSEYVSTASDATRPVLSAVACFVSFVVNGLVPTLVYAAVGGRLLAVAMFSLVQLMLLWSARSHLVGENVLRGLLQTSLLGGAAGGVAYAVGRLVHSLQ